MKSVLPLYVAVMLCVPTASFAVVYFALPSLRGLGLQGRRAIVEGHGPGDRTAELR